MGRAEMEGAWLAWLLMAMGDARRVRLCTMPTRACGLLAWVVLINARVVWLGCHGKAGRRSTCVCGDEGEGTERERKSEGSVRG